MLQISKSRHPDVTTYNRLGTNNFDSTNFIKNLFGPGEHDGFLGRVIDFKIDSLYLKH